MFAEIAKILEIGFAYFSQEEAFEAGITLAIIEAHLGKEPMGFAAAASAAEADGEGPVRLIAEAGGGAGSELASVQGATGKQKVLDLIVRAAGFQPKGNQPIEVRELVHIRDHEEGGV